MFSFQEIYNGYPAQSPEALFGLFKREFLEGNANSDAAQLLIDCYEEAARYLPAPARGAEPVVNHSLRVGLILLHERFFDDDVLAAALLLDLFSRTSYTFDMLQKKFGTHIATFIRTIQTLRNTEKSFLDFAQDAYDASDLFTPLLESTTRYYRAFFVLFADRLDRLYTMPDRLSAYDQKLLDGAQQFLEPLTRQLNAERFTAFFKDAFFRNEHRRVYENVCAFVQRENPFPTIRKTVDRLSDAFCEQFDKIYPVYPLASEAYAYMFDKSRQEIVYDISRIECKLYFISRNIMSLPTPEKTILSFLPERPLNRYALEEIEENGFLFADEYLNRYHAIIVSYEAFDILLHGEADDELSTPEFNEENEYVEGSIIVKTPESKVIVLPVGATVIDFAFRIHTELGLHFARALRNGKEVAPTAVLRHGDTVQIVSSKDAEPKVSWLLSCKTKYAQKIICRYLQSRLNQEGKKPSPDNNKNHV